MEQRLPSWKKGLWLTLTAGIAAALVILLLTIDEYTLESLGKIEPIYLLVAVAMVVVLWILEGIRIRSIVYALGEKVPPVGAAVEVFLITFFFASITPCAIGEWPAHIYALNRNGLSIGGATAAAVMRSFLTKSLFAVVAIAFLIAYQGCLTTHFYNEIFKYAFVAAGAQVLFSLLALGKPEIIRFFLERLSCSRFTRRLSGRFPVRRIFTYLFREIDNFQDSTRILGRRGVGVLVVPALYTALFWLCYFSIAPVLLLGLGIEPPYFRTLIWQIMVFMVIFYIPLPGGSGVAEVSLASLFAVFVPSSVIGVYVVVWRFFTYYATLLFGGVVALGKIRLQ